MKRARSNGKASGRAHDCSGTAGQVTPEADLTWLLHRAAQRLRSAVEEQAAKHGLDLRALLVLKALETKQEQTQLALGQALGLDKTTLTLLLDRLEKDGLVVRRADPNDRRARIPESTAAGRALHARIAREVTETEKKLLSGFSAAEQRSFRVMLCQLIGAGEGTESISGSCV